ncbi:DUF1885 family protein [Peribacillus sp. B-H-3]|uniref:DUF1885 family protein n=1 Tax=Peribacillus sp. B-H-3 TaxID=3400420 RepID=UPI003B01D208
MPESAFIKLVPQSNRQSITLEEVKDLFRYYKSLREKTGKQIDWDYQNSAFPYKMEVVDQSQEKWIRFVSNQDRYNGMLAGINTEKIEDKTGTERFQPYIQIKLVPASTYGDKGKANEYCRFIAKKLNAELHLFNKRIMYFYPRK